MVEKAKYNRLEDLLATAHKRLLLRAVSEPLSDPRGDPWGAAVVAGVSKRTCCVSCDK